MVIFHSYVKLPEGIKMENDLTHKKRRTHFTIKRETSLYLCLKIRVNPDPNLCTFQQKYRKINHRFFWVDYDELVVTWPILCLLTQEMFHHVDGNSRMMWSY